MDFLFHPSRKRGHSDNAPPATVSSCQLRKGTARSSCVGLSQDAVAGIRSASLLRLRLSHPRLLFVAHCCCWRLLLLLLFLVDFFNFFFGFGLVWFGWEGEEGEGEEV